MVNVSNSQIAVNYIDETKTYSLSVEQGLSADRCWAFFIRRDVNMYESKNCTTNDVECCTKRKDGKYFFNKDGKCWKRRKCLDTPREFPRE
jgi:hypothetical protein